MMIKKKQAVSLVDESDQKNKIECKRHIVLLLFTGVATTLGSAVPAGYCIGVTNSLHEYIKDWTMETVLKRYDWNITKESLDIVWATIVSIFLIGGAIGSLTGACIANRFGRRASYLICCILFIIGAVCFMCCRLCSSLELILLGRFIVGLGAGLTTAVLPMYLSELATLKLRGTLAVFCHIGVTAGVVIGQVASLNDCFGSVDYWQIALSFYIVLVIVCFIPCFFYPESPKWLIVVKKNADEGERQLKRLRGNDDKIQIEKELMDLQNESQAEGKSSTSFKDVLTNSKLVLPLFIVCVFLGGQQLSGINAIFYYSISIFLKAGLSREEAEWANLGAGVLNLCASLMGPLLMTKVNRRPLMMISSLSCGFSLLSFALMLHFIEVEPFLANVCISCLFLYIFFFQFGIGPIPFFIGAELFEVGPRPVAMSIGSLSSWTCNFLIGMTFPSLERIWGAFVFLPFAIACLFIFLVTKFYLPETRGRDPSQVAPLMEQGFKSKIH